ncbi:serine-rich adhesin for platelets [Musca domestica]|uniref:Serine-rich adhesin for platelets n=1 Tax=Musca domestica TaxID=7370 RepID=A0A1I8N5H4_MUSDO|nr:serine-rich adhesin for platelets [Musca domestica]XP_058986509.1 serine-rich adhesin for platelets [Musca domestica]
MPRNAAKKANKNTKSLPISVKFLTTKVNNKKKRNLNNKSKHNNNKKTKKKKNLNNSDTNKHNQKQKESQQQQQRGQKRKKALKQPANARIVTESTSTSFAADNNDADDDDCDANSTTAVTPLTRPTAATTTTAPTERCKFTINSQDLKVLSSSTTSFSSGLSQTTLSSNRSSVNTVDADQTCGVGGGGVKHSPATATSQRGVEKQKPQQQQNTILKYLKNQRNSKNNLGDNNADDVVGLGSAEETSNIDIHNNKEKDKVQVATTTLLSITTATEISVAAASSPALPLATTTTATNQRQCRLSTLYPIVIETHISESQSLAGEVKTTTPTTAAATTTKHSISNTNTTGNCSTNSAIVLKTSDTTTALDTTLSKQTAGADDATKQILQNKSPSPQQQPAKRRKRRYFHQPHEVKARLDSLRTRKAPGDTEQQQQKTQQEQQQQQPHKVDKSLEISQKSTALVQDIAKQQQQQPEAGNKYKFLQAPDTEETSRKRVFPILDVATLNRIETLSDNEVKKPASKRKRSQTAALLGFNIPTTLRSRRVTATAQAAVIVAAAAAAAAASAATSGCGIGVGLRTTPSIAGGGGGGGLVVQKRQQQLAGGGDFLKPLPIEAGITNSKKRPRIMSLYERPYQTANDGRGGSSSLVSNGYMSTSRSSSSGGAGMPMIMSDSNDSQDMTNAYYLTGNSGSGIAGSSSASSAAAAALLGNGGGVGIALNHAPTMGTLCNIGNTCYLNSVVYTLRFAPQFLHNLHHLLTDLNALQQNIARARSKSSSLGRGISAVHIENARSWSSKDLASMEQYAGSNAAPNPIVNASTPSSGPSSSSALSQVTQKSSHQILTEKLHELYQSLYRNEMSESMEPYHADTLLHAIQDVSSIFEGNQQQDAHEFLMCLLNSIRETNQTLIKAIAECPDVILNGYISNPEDTERDIKQSNNSTSSSGGIISNSNHISVTSALSSLTSNSKSSSFFSRKSKRKDETKNSKNSRLQSPLKDNQIAGNITPQSNSLFYLNTNDLNSTAAAGVTSTSPPSAGGGVGVSVATGGGSSSLASPSNSTATTAGNGGDELDAAGASSSSNSTAVSLLLKDKQRLESKIRELGLDFFNDDFEGITVSTTKCLSCETITEQKETMIDIAVPVPQAGYESNEYNTDRPSSFIQNSCITSERFRNENKYRCEQCCGYTEAIRSISYEVLPRLLIIQLSRFSGGMEKINSYIPTSFTLQCFCSKCCELSDANKLHIYKLYSVITHVGATMSVGHYIAYTCSLDWANEYINCPKEQRRRASQERAAAAAAAAAAMNGSGGTTLTSNPMQQAGSTSSTTNANNVGSSNNSSSSSGTTSFMKIMKFGRSKASSSGDMSKHVKHLNGLTSSGGSGSGSGSGGGSKAITNGIGKLSMNNTNSAGGTSSAASSSASASCASSTTCPSINCCAMRLTAQQQMHYVHANQQNNINDFNEDSSGYTNGVTSSGYSSSNYNNNMQQQPPYNSGSSNNSSGYGSTGRSGTKASYASSQQQLHNGSEPIWYMCDDDKIKAMTQREFEELLSPARKITITPYLLFYARYNLQSSSPPKSAGSSSSPGPVTSSPQASWSNESLQSSGHSAHSSGMRM